MCTEDLFNFDFTELEIDGRNIFSSNDHWLYDSDVIGTSFVRMADLSERRQQIAVWWKTQPQLWSPVLNPFILNWLDKRATRKDWEVEVQRAIFYLKENGSSRDKQLDLSALGTDTEEKHCEVGRKRTVAWGDSISTNDCWCVQLQLGRLSFYIVDFGDSLHLIPDMRRDLKTGNSTEFNQCALLKLAAGLEWIG